MTAWSTLRTRMRGLALRDNATNQRWSDADLLDLANSMIRASWPSLFAYAVDASLTTQYTTAVDGSAYGVTRYSLPSGVPTYPERLPIYMVQHGPVGGIRVSDSNQTSDRYKIIRGWAGGRTAWEVDWAARQLVFQRPPLVDFNGAYTYYLRLYYVRPLAQLSADTDVLEGPAGLEDAILDWARMRAMEGTMRTASPNVERLQGIGSIAREARDTVTMLIEKLGLRMQWPKVVR